MKKIQYLLLCSLMLLLASCEEDTVATNFAPSVSTGNASDIYRKGAVLSGSIRMVLIPLAYTRNFPLKVAGCVFTHPYKEPKPQKSREKTEKSREKTIIFAQ